MKIFRLFFGKTGLYVKSGGNGRKGPTEWYRPWSWFK